MRTIPVLSVRAMELPLVLGVCWDRVKALRARPDFPAPFRALDERSRPLWLVSDLQAYLERRRSEACRELVQEGPPPFRPGAAAAAPSVEEAQHSDAPAPAVVPAARGDVSTASAPEATAAPHLAGGAAECARDAGGGGSHDCAETACPHGECWRCGDCPCMEDTDPTFSEAAGLRDLGWQA